MMGYDGMGNTLYGQREKIMIKLCVICGKEFEGRKNKLTCSKSCHSQYINQYFHLYYQQYGRPDRSYIAPQTRVCVICGKEFTTKYSRKKTCSDECSRKHHRQLTLCSHYRNSANPEKREYKQRYNKEYGKKNRQRLSEYVKERYHTNAEFRRKVLLRNERYRNKKKTTEGEQ